MHDRTGGIILPFINVGNNDITTYKYSPKYTAAFPKLKNTWVLFVDYDNDGKEDLWASIDFKVVLQRNITKTGDKMVKFQQVSPFLRAFKYSGIPGLDSVNISSSFNNIPTIADVDGDGDIDFFSYQDVEGNLLLYRNMTVDFSLPIHPPVFDLAWFRIPAVRVRPYFSSLWPDFVYRRMLCLCHRNAWANPPPEKYQADFTGASCRRLPAA